MYILFGGVKFTYEETVIGVSANLDRLLQIKARMEAEGHTVTDEDGDATTYNMFWISEAPVL